VERLTGPIIDSESEMVRRDGAGNGVTELLDSLNCSPSRCMFQDNAEPRKLEMKLFEVGKE